MTRVCLVGEAETNLRYELLSRETARRALATYDLAEPFQNTVAVETVSLGAAVSLLNDLNWYLVRFAADAMVFEPSVSETEWVSRDLATAIRDDEIEVDESGRFLKVYGVVEPERAADLEAATPGGSGESAPTDRVEGDPEATSADGSDAAADDEPAGEPAEDAEGADPPALVEPMYVTRTGDTLPEYDLRPVDDTLRVRVTETEFGA